MSLAIAKPLPLPCLHVLNNVHPVSWIAHPKFQHFWSKCLTMMPRQTYIQTYIHIYKPKYILKCVRRSNSLRPSVIHKKKFSNLFALYTNGKKCSQEGSRPCYSQSQVVYAYHVLSLSIHEFVVPFLAFSGPNMKTKMGVVMYIYLIHSPDCIHS